MKHHSNYPMGWRPPPPPCMCRRKAKLPGELSPQEPETISSTFKSQIRLSRSEWLSVRACRVCPPSAFAANSGSAFLYLENPLCPRTNSSKPSTYNILLGTSLLPASNGIGFGFSLFCLWPQAFSSRVFLGLKYEMARYIFPR